MTRTNFAWLAFPQFAAHFNRAETASVTYTVCSGSSISRVKGSCWSKRADSQPYFSKINCLFIFPFIVRSVFRVRLSAAWLDGLLTHNKRSTDLSQDFNEFIFNVFDSVICSLLDAQDDICITTSAEQKLLDCLIFTRTCELSKNRNDP